MTNSRKTKRALLSSVTTLLLCFAMLIGSTFAWFTDTAEASVNQIKSGTLDVQIVDTNGNDLPSLKFQNQQGSDSILWEPNATFRTQAFQIKNSGSLALKYKIAINGIDGDTGLLKVIDFSIVKEGGEAYDLAAFEGNLAANQTASDTLYLQGHMDANATNEYQGLTLNGITVTVYATQLESEFDSNGSSYDANAGYLVPWDGSEGNASNAPTADQQGIIHITSAADLVNFAASVNNYNRYNGQTVVLDSNIDLGNQPWTPIGKVTESQSNPYFMGTFDGQGHTIYGLNVDKSNTTDLGYTTAGLFGWIDEGGATIKNLTISGATVKGNHYTGALVGYLSGTVENCHVVNSNITSVSYDTDNDGDKAGGLVGYAQNSTVKNCTVNNTGVIGKRDVGGLIGCTKDATCTVTGNTVSDTTVTYSTNNGGEIVGRPMQTTITANTANNVTVASGTYIANGVTLNADGEYMISSAEGLKYCATNFTRSDTTINKVFKLTADVDMTGITWEPWCNEQQYFGGLFDGQNHTIKNLTINDTHTANDGHAVGFIGRLGENANGEKILKNVTFDNANVSGHHYVGVAVGYNEFGKVDDVKVTNSKVTATHVEGADSCGDKAGALIGMCSPNAGYISVTNCSASNCEVKAARDAAQLIGFGYTSNNNNPYSNLSATNVTVTAVVGSCAHERAGIVSANALVGNGTATGLALS